MPKGIAKTDLEKEVEQILARIHKDLDRLREISAAAADDHRRLTKLRAYWSTPAPVHIEAHWDKNEDLKRYQRPTGV
jgi:hypothetical protein